MNYDFCLAEDNRFMPDPISIRSSVLCTGMHRSGTTWTGRAMAAAYDLKYVHEPSNPQINSRIGGFYLASNAWPDVAAVYGHALCDGAAARIRLAAHGSVRAAPRRFLDALSRRTPLIKDPFAVFNVPVLLDATEIEVVFCVRHPAAVASSAARLGWQIDISEVFRQARLLEQLDDEARNLVARYERSNSILERTSVMWKVLHGWWRERGLLEHPSVVVARHESLVDVPELILQLGGSRTANLASFCRFLERTRPPGESIVESGRHDDIVRNVVSMRRPWHRRLSEKELATVRRIAGAEAEAWSYGPDSW